MKKVLQWIGITVAYLGLGTMMFFGIPFLLGLLMVFGLESEHAAMDDHAEAALRETGLTAYTEHATWHDLTIDGTLTAFVMPKYDNHVDNTDLRAGLMALAAGTDGWHVEAVSAADYAALVPEGLPETFTARELAGALRLPGGRGSAAANVLSYMGVLRRAGARGKAYLYTIAKEEETC